MLNRLDRFLMRPHWISGKGVYFLAAAYLIQFLLVVLFSVDIPYWDEWLQLGAKNFAELGPWLLKRNNEHYIIPTKLQNWLLYLSTGGNFAVAQFLNYLWFGFLTGLAIYTVRTACPQMSLSAICYFFLFFMSPRIYENHTWAFQNQFHFTLLFLVGSVFFLFKHNFSTKNVLLGTLCLVGSTFSFASGVASAPVIFLIFVTFCFVHRSKLRPTQVAGIVTGGCLMALAVFFWLHNFKKISHHPQPAFPHEQPFWLFIVNCLSAGFGVRGYSVAIGLICVILMLGPSFWMISQKTKLTEAQWRLIAVVMGVTAGIACIGLGRAPFGQGWAKGSRYLEFPILILPFAAAGWHWVLRKDKKIQTVFLRLVWLATFASFIEDWNYHRYWEISRDRKIGRSCLGDFIESPTSSAPQCPTVYFSDITQPLEEAKRLNLSFLRKLTPGSRQTP